MAQNEMTGRTLMAMRHEMETQGNAFLQGLAMFNALAREHEIEPVTLIVPNTDPIDPLIRREYAVRLRLMDMGLHLERTSGDDRRYKIACPNRASAPDEYSLTLEDVETLVPNLREITAEVWSPAAIKRLQGFVAARGLDS